MGKSDLRPNSSTLVSSGIQPVCPDFRPADFGIALPSTRSTLYQLPFPAIILTTLGQFTGVAIIVLGILQTDLWHFVGLRQIMAQENQRSSKMITSGLYGWVRHPLYTGGLLLIWLMPVMTINFLTLFILLTIYLIVGAKSEEERLIHEFGDDYREYQKTVPMLLPSLRRR